jgi:tetratricopeptide (TPR) repeat protein
VIFSPQWQSIKRVVSICLKIPFLPIFLVTGIGCISLGAVQWQRFCTKVLARETPSEQRSSQNSARAHLAAAHTNNSQEEALRIEGTPNSLLHAFIGDELFTRGDYLGAVDCYRESITGNPTFELLHLKLGVSLNRLNRSDEAIECFREALYIAPDFADAHQALGLALLNKMNFADAAGHLHEVTQIRPNDPAAHNFLGVALARQSKLTSARTSFAKAIHLRSLYPEARFNLAQVHLQTGAFIDAARELDQALRINPEFAAAKTARERLAMSLRPRPATTLAQNTGGF